MRILVPMIGLALGACAIGEVASVDTPEPEPPYRKIVAENMYKVLPRFPKPVDPQAKKRAGKQADAQTATSSAPPEDKDKANPLLVTVDVPTSLSSYQISGVRRVHHLVGWAWVTCLRIADQPGPIAIFIRNNEVVDSRRSVLIDGCESQTYEVLQVPKSPPARRPRQQ